jgi:hypothetical protein
LNLPSFDRLGIDAKRLLAVALGIGTGVAFLFEALGEPALGSAATELGIATASVVAYMVMTLPRRIAESTALSQAQESPTIAVLASAILGATHSRSRTFLMLRAENPELALVLDRIKRAILLGYPLPRAVDSTAQSLASYTAADALTKVATLSTESIEESDQERGGIVKALEMAEETKLPLLMTACFFVPILLLLLAAFSHLEDPRNLALLLGLQVLLVDVVFHFSATGRRRLSQ